MASNRAVPLVLVVLLIALACFCASPGVCAQARGSVPPELLAHLTSPGEGWTAFQPAPDTRMIFVSSSEGADANDGLSPERPLKTISKGFALLRNDHSDWLLLKRGDVWYEPLGRIGSSNLKNGRSEEQPTLLASYGASGPRPLLKLGDHGSGLSVALQGYVKPMKNLAVVGIHFYDEKGDPNSKEFVRDRRKGGAGISWRGGPGENLLIEDCRFEWLSGGAIMGGVGWMPPGTDRKPFAKLKMKNVKIRRCVAAYAWSTEGHCQGFFFSKVDGLLLEENVLDHNGWCLETGDVPTWFNHNVYVSISNDNVVARGNIVARGSTTGIYCRTNGILEDNLCLDNTPSLNLGRINPPRPGGVTGRVAGNVIITAGVRKLPQAARFSNPAIEVANVNNDGAVVENNIIIGDPSTGPAAIQVASHGVGAHNVIVRNNTVYNWAPVFRCFGTAGKELKKGAVSGLELRNNLFQAWTEYEGDLIEEVRGPAGIVYDGNVYHTPSGRVGAGEAGRSEPVRFTDPTRTAATYHKSLGREGTREAFLSGAHKQSKHNWREEYTARAVIAYIREGFKPVTELGDKQIGAVPAE